MANTYNQVNLLGRIIANIELKTTSSGIPFCNFSVVVQRNYKSKEGNYDADFIRCAASGKTAEFIAKHFGTKGTLISLSGAFKNNNFTDKDGVKHYDYNIVVDNVSFVPGNKIVTPVPTPAQTAPQPSAQPATANSAASGTESRAFDIIDDEDLPF